MPQQNDPIVVTPFVPDARLEADDFRPVYREAGHDPKAESAPEPATAAPAKAGAKKVSPRKAPTKKAAPAPSETIAIVGEELPPA